MPVIGKAGDIAPGQAKAFDVEGKRVAVFNIDGKFYAIDDTCSHRGGPLSEGDVQGLEVTCPWHGAAFDICTGKACDQGPFMRGAPETAHLKSYGVKVVGSDLEVQL